MLAAGHLIANVKFEQVKIWAAGHLIANVKFEQLKMRAVGNICDRLNSSRYNTAFGHYLRMLHPACDVNRARGHSVGRHLRC